MDSLVSGERVVSGESHSVFQAWRALESQNHGASWRRPERGSALVLTVLTPKGFPRLIPLWAMNPLLSVRIFHVCWVEAKILDL